MTWEDILRAVHRPEQKDLVVPVVVARRSVVRIPITLELDLDDIRSRLSSESLVQILDDLACEQGLEEADLTQGLDEQEASYEVVDSPWSHKDG